MLIRINYGVVCGAKSILLLLITLYVTGRYAWADPVADISFVSSLDCHKESRRCGAVFVGGDYAGSKLGLEINKNLGGVIRVDLKDGDAYPLHIAAGGVAGATITLTWDGDYNPRQLSSIGLNCLDVTHLESLIVPMRFDDARNDGLAEQAKQHTFSARLIAYNGKDPTGQKYSISSALQSGENIEFKKDNFTRNGPRGAVDFSCVGAITLALQVDEPLEMSLWLGQPGEIAPAFVKDPLAGNSPATQDKRAVGGVRDMNVPIESKTPVLQSDRIPQVEGNPLYVRDFESGGSLDIEPSDSSDTWDSAEEDVLVFGEAARTH